MRLKIQTLIITILFATTAIMQAQQSVRTNAIKANNYGVVYSLPKTSLSVTVKVKKTVYTRGEFYQFAQRYLNIDPITESNTEYTIEEVFVDNIGVPNPDQSFMVIFNPKSIAPFVELTVDGLIGAINTDAIIEGKANYQLPAPSAAPINARRFLGEEVLMAGSTAKQAELVSRQIFDLRRSKNDILIGEADNMPPDGEAYKIVMEQIDNQERALTELFTGNIQTEYFTKEINVVPNNQDIDRMVIGRFSKKLGPIDADNLAGEPIYLSLKRKNPRPEIFLTDKEKQSFDKKLSEGVVYNIPAKAQLTIEFNNRVLNNQEIDIVQFGTQDVLTKRMLDNKKQPIKVEFFPNLGAIKQIIQ